MAFTGQDITKIGPRSNSSYKPPSVKIPNEDLGHRSLGQTYGAAGQSIGNTFSAFANIHKNAIDLERNIKWNDAQIFLNTLKTTQNLNLKNELRKQSSENLSLIIDSETGISPLENILSDFIKKTFPVDKGQGLGGNSDKLSYEMLRELHKGDEKISSALNVAISNAETAIKVKGFTEAIKIYETRGLDQIKNASQGLMETIERQALFSSSKSFKDDGDNTDPDNVIGRLKARKIVKEEHTQLGEITKSFLNIAKLSNTESIISEYNKLLVNFSVREFLADYKHTLLYGDYKKLIDRIDNNYYEIKGIKDLEVNKDGEVVFTNYLKRLVLPLPEIEKEYFKILELDKDLDSDKKNIKRFNAYRDYGQSIALMQQFLDKFTIRYKIGDEFIYKFSEDFFTKNNGENEGLREKLNILKNKFVKAVNSDAAKSDKIKITDKNLDTVKRKYVLDKGREMMGYTPGARVDEVYNSIDNENYVLFEEEIKKGLKSLEGLNISVPDMNNGLSSQNDLIKTSGKILQMVRSSPYAPYFSGVFDPFLNRAKDLIELPRTDFLIETSDPELRKEFREKNSSNRISESAITVLNKRSFNEYGEGIYIPEALEDKFIDSVTPKFKEGGQLSLANIKATIDELLHFSEDPTVNKNILKKFSKNLKRDETGIEGIIGEILSKGGNLFMNMDIKRQVDLIQSLNQKQEDSFYNKFYQSISLLDSKIDTPLDMFNDRVQRTRYRKLIAHLANGMSGQEINSKSDSDDFFPFINKAFTEYFGKSIVYARTDAGHVVYFPKIIANQFTSPEGDVDEQNLDFKFGIQAYAQHLLHPDKILQLFDYDEDLKQYTGKIGADVIFTFDKNEADIIANALASGRLEGLKISAVNFDNDYYPALIWQDPSLNGKGIVVHIWRDEKYRTTSEEFTKHFYTARKGVQWVERLEGIIPSGLREGVTNLFPEAAVPEAAVTYKEFIALLNEYSYERNAGGGMPGGGGIDPDGWLLTSLNKPGNAEYEVMTIIDDMVVKLEKKYPNVSLEKLYHAALDTYKTKFRSWSKRTQDYWDKVGGRNIFIDKDNKIIIEDVDPVGSRLGTPSNLSIKTTEEFKDLKDGGLNIIKTLDKFLGDAWDSILGNLKRNSPLPRE